LTQRPGGRELKKKLRQPENISWGHHDAVPRT
jgi:hypothetical protein